MLSMHATEPLAMASSSRCCSCVSPPGRRPAGTRCTFCTASAPAAPAAAAAPSSAPPSCGGGAEGGSALVVVASSSTPAAPTAPAAPLPSAADATLVAGDATPPADADTPAPAAAAAAAGTLVAAPSPGPAAPDSWLTPPLPGAAAAAGGGSGRLLPEARPLAAPRAPPGWRGGSRARAPAAAAPAASALLPSACLSRQLVSSGSGSCKNSLTRRHWPPRASPGRPCPIRKASPTSHLPAQRRRRRFHARAGACARQESGGSAATAPWMRCAEVKRSRRALSPARPARPIICRYCARLSSARVCVWGHRVHHASISSSTTTRAQKVRVRASVQGAWACSGARARPTEERQAPGLIGNGASQPGPRPAPQHHDATAPRLAFCASAPPPARTCLALRQAAQHHPPRRQVDAGGQRGRGRDDQHLARQVGALHGAARLLRQPRMVVRHAARCNRPSNPPGATTNSVCALASFLSMRVSAENQDETLRHCGRRGRSAAAELGLRQFVARPWCHSPNHHVPSPHRGTSPGRGPARRRLRRAAPPPAARAPRAPPVARRAPPAWPGAAGPRAAWPAAGTCRALRARHEHTRVHAHAHICNGPPRRLALVPGGA